MTTTITVEQHDLIARLGPLPQPLVRRLLVAFLAMLTEDAPPTVTGIVRPKTKSQRRDDRLIYGVLLGLADDIAVRPGLDMAVLHLGRALGLVSESFPVEPIDAAVPERPMAAYWNLTA